MSKVQLGILVGSLRKDSINLNLAHVLASLGKDSFDSKFIRIDDLPLFNQDLESNRPESVLSLKREIESSQALLFVTPEYNRSMPGVLKNALDWASRPYGSNSLDQKPGALIGTSPGPLGTACAQQATRLVLGYLNIRLMGQPEAYVQFKDPLDNQTTGFLKSFMDAFKHHCA